jgi:hypothetical protein
MATHPHVRDRALPTRHTRSCRAVIGKCRDRDLSSASACSPRCTRAAVAACPPVVKAPRAHRLWASFIDGPGPESQLDILAINVRLIYGAVRRGAWTIPVLFYAQGITRILPGEGHVMPATRPHDPQHSPLRTQARLRFTQVIHMDVHSQPAKFTRMNRAGRYPTHRSLPQRLTARWSLTSALTDDARTTSRGGQDPAFRVGGGTSLEAIWLSPSGPGSPGLCWENRLALSK